MSGMCALHLTVQIANTSLLVPCSVHSGTTIGLNPLKWPKADPEGYKDGFKSFLKFANGCFSKSSDNS